MDRSRRRTDQRAGEHSTGSSPQPTEQRSSHAMTGPKAVAAPPSGQRTITTEPGAWPTPVRRSSLGRDHRAAAGSRPWRDPFATAPRRPASWSSTCRLCPARRSPHEHGGFLEYLEKSRRPRRALGGAEGAGDGFGNVRDVATGPAAHLVPERSAPPQPCCPDRSLTEHASILVGDIRQRPHLDGIGLLVEADHQTGVIEVERCPASAPGREPLVHATVEPHEVSARPERQPIEVHPARHPSNLGPVWQPVNVPGRSLGRGGPRAARRPRLRRWPRD